MACNEHMQHTTFVMQLVTTHLIKCQPVGRARWSRRMPAWTLRVCDNMFPSTATLRPSPQSPGYMCQNRRTSCNPPYFVWVKLRDGISVVLSNPRHERRTPSNTSLSASRAPGLTCRSGPGQPTHTQPDTPPKYPKPTQTDHKGIVVASSAHVP